MSCGDLFLGLIAILFPPIAVWIKSGLCSADSLINILLCMLGYLPGLLHAWYIIARHPERDYDYEVLPDAERQGGQHAARVTYYFIRHEPRRDYGTQGQGQAQGQGHNRPAPPPPSGQGSNRPAPPPPASNGSQSQAQSQRPPQGPSVGAGSDEPGAPPSYSEVVKGDNKIQTQD
ncbi:hypothetical protein PV04_08609 [Phialophora macrospora]|uniref:Stress response RCI peptide n=1 Tax=Phialophora macrospora TaxID=1851006 RepID=A0A0D2F6P9_9EURO|nr:hypothetical protein PV04_08609 [Phialophora macrospora]